MSAKIRPYKKGQQHGWEVDIRLRLPNGSWHRERRKAPVNSRSGAQRWAEARERELLSRGNCPVDVKPEPPKQIPTLREFYPRFIREYCEAERLKPSGIEAKESHFRTHLLPALGDRCLHEITTADVQQLKVALQQRRPKTVNNILSTLNVALDMGVQWGLIESLPCKIRLLPVTSAAPAWYEPHDYARLVQAAARLDPRIEVLMRLGGDAGLRRGEMMALRQCDIDFTRQILTVEKSIWQGNETLPKSGRGRKIPMTAALLRCLRAARHLRGPRVLYTDQGVELTAKVVRNWMERAQRLAGMEVNGSIHRLRHTFCSLLAMKGAPAKAIQELAGHANLSTTLRYMHLSPAARDSAIRLLDQPFQESPDDVRGDILETAIK